MTAGVTPWPAGARPDLKLVRLAMSQRLTRAGEELAGGEIGNVEVDRPDDDILQPLALPDPPHWSEDAENLPASENGWGRSSPDAGGVDEESGVFTLFQLASEASAAESLRSFARESPAALYTRSEGEIRLGQHLLPYGSTCLHAAACSGNAEGVAAILAEIGPAGAKEREKGEGHLANTRMGGPYNHQAAAEAGSSPATPIVPTVFSTPTSLLTGVFNSQGYTALMLAAAGGHLPCVELLIPFEAGLSSPKTAERPQYRDKPRLWVAGRTALHCAAEARAYSCVPALAPHEAGLFQHSWRTHRHTDRTKYVVEGFRCALDFLRTHSAGRPGEDGPLYRRALESLAPEAWFSAAVEGRLDALEAMKAGNTGRTNPAGQTALYLAVTAGRAESAAALAAEAWIPTRAGDLPLALAIRNGRDDIAQELHARMDHGRAPDAAVAEACYGPGRSALDLAMDLGRQGMYGVLSRQLMVL